MKPPTEYSTFDAEPHMQRPLIVREVVVTVTDGMLDFRPSERIFYDEFNGRRAKRVLPKVIGE